jgi:hypothetical protein
MQPLLFFKCFAIRHLFLQLYFYGTEGYWSVEDITGPRLGKKCATTWRFEKVGKETKTRALNSFFNTVGNGNSRSKNRTF